MRLSRLVVVDQFRRYVWDIRARLLGVKDPAARWSLERDLLASLVKCGWLVGCGSLPAGADRVLARWANWFIYR